MKVSMPSFCSLSARPLPHRSSGLEEFFIVFNNVSIINIPISIRAFLITDLRLHRLILAKFILCMLLRINSWALPMLCEHSCH